MEENKEGELGQYSLKEAKQDLNNLWKIWKSYGSHFVAPLILLALVILAVNLVEDNHLKKEILSSSNCGYTDLKEGIKCYCRQSDVDEILAKIDPTTMLLPILENASGGLERYKFSFENSSYDNTSLED